MRCHALDIYWMVEFLYRAIRTLSIDRRDSEKSSLDEFMANIYWFVMVFSAWFPSWHIVSWQYARRADHYTAYMDTRASPQGLMEIAVTPKNFS